MTNFQNEFNIAIQIKYRVHTRIINKTIIISSLMLHVQSLLTIFKLINAYYENSQ